MPTSRSRSRSGSPQLKHKHHHKKRSRSKSPSEGHRSTRHAVDRKRRSDREREVDRDRDHHRHHHHHRHDSGDEEATHSRRIKPEPSDHGYEQQHHNRPSTTSGRGHHHHSQPDRDQHDHRRRQDHGRKMQNIKSEPSENNRQQWGKKGDDKKDDDKPAVEKEKPNFGLSGKLTEDTNSFRGVVIKYNEPPEARKPKKKWRWYPFKGEDTLPVLHLHRQSAFMLGRDRRVADIPTDHPSCSKQHAVLQFRMVEFRREDESTGRRVRPYIIDLGSANGTYLNNERVESEKYYELKEKDVVKFGFSSREYVLLHDATDTTVVEDEGTP